MQKLPQILTSNALLSAPKISTDLLWGLTLFFCVLAFIYTISVFVFRNKISKEAKLVRQKKKELTPIISEFLFYDAKGDKIEKINYIGLKVEIRELIKNDFDRKVLTEILMDLRKDVSGAIRSELFHIYKDLELHKDAYKNLKSWRWEVVSKGVLELTQMNVTESYSIITQFINDKRSTIRKQAEIATVSLKEDGISFFLDNTKYKISEWQQLKLLDVVRNKENFIPPAFRLWLTSKNNYVVLFSLRLIKYYNQNDAHASLIELVKHKNNHIKREAIQCITTFHITEAIPVLKLVFKKCTTDIKMTILEALGELGAKEEIDFLKQVELTDKDFTVRNKAVRAINTISPEIILPTKDIKPDVEWKKEAAIETFNKVEVIKSNQDIPKDVVPVAEDKTATRSNKKTEIKNLTMDMDIHPEELSFLPVVTEEINTNVEAKNNTTKPLAEFPVFYEEVTAVKSLEELNVDFLPIVKKNYADEENDISNVDVTFETVAPTAHSNDIADSNVISNEVKVDQLHGIDDPLASAKLSEKDKPFNVRELDLIFEEIGIETFEPIATEMEIDWSAAFQQIEISNTLKDENEILKILDTAEKTQNEIRAHNEPNVPKPKFLAPKSLETMALLEDISELGDHREIPYLKLLLEKEHSPIVRQRIEGLIASFATNRAENNFKITKLEPGHSVFHELFKNSDVESKLLLLHEVASVGDEKELPLLHSLLEDPSNIVRKRAALTLESLNERLLKEVNSEVAETSIATIATDQVILDNRDQSSKEGKESLLDIPFELEKTGAFPIKNKKTLPVRASGGTLFDHLCAVSTKFYNKLNG